MNTTPPRDSAQERQNQTATVAFNELFAAMVKAGTLLPHLALCLDEPGVPLDLGRLSALDCLNLARRLNLLLALEAEVRRSRTDLLERKRRKAAQS
ncbi:hypothetical protein OG897_02470 [Streptomyces sp. NBC_00237]|uniref:hypothetical protein n=1 Tax=Streptomyces sp. NBC_00237 TaxID=2975687 RepID=UPI00224EA2EA|nr:hypothetical protein [Streptomyces sp. NBC_00237]MCX5200329.1 hypothetical protein [Streptomyces sp. NBC_00237]